MKYWPSHTGCDKELTADQIQNIKAFISENLPNTGTGSFMRRVLFSKSNEINWYYTANFFSHENPHLSQSLLNLVYPD